MRTTLAAKRAEVWGTPIGHSRSPALHTAAYEVLGWDVTYGAREVGIDALGSLVADIDSSWVGVSLTMPLKEAILPLVSAHRELVDALGVANTIVVREGNLYLENTDPFGVRQALVLGGDKGFTQAAVLGAGATARSVIYALHQLGVERVSLVSRDHARSERTLECASVLGLEVAWVPLDSWADIGGVELVASTLPADAKVRDVPSAVVEGSALFDVAYHPWPSSLARVWQQANRPVISGMSMLVYQAIAQIRLFHSDDMEVPVPGEDRVLEAMWRSVGGPFASGPPADVKQ